ncbi:hypothetical protein QE152_g38576 [Popillia japonica]|uniref:Uncharacterized protein n=1 Tax=Popillia japonica TaxID=7064 RepID=A0AAW1HXD6_POPJA
MPHPPNRLSFGHSTCLLRTGKAKTKHFDIKEEINMQNVHKTVATKSRKTFCTAVFDTLYSRYFTSWISNQF